MLSKADISNFEWQNWQLCKREDLLATAKAWQDAPSVAACKALYKQNGVHTERLFPLSWKNSKAMKE
jgi:hypothetical protein